MNARNVVVALDSFKGSIDARSACEAVADGLRRGGAGGVVEMPVADGGEGLIDSLSASGFERVEARVHDPLGRPITAVWARRGDTAVVELAQASGLNRSSRGSDAAVRASTFGTGELLAAALQSGAKKVIVGLGGSATTDGGAGLLAALGVQLFDEAAARLDATSSLLDRVAKVDFSGLIPALRRPSGVTIEVACDVDNPLCGKAGAAAVFGPQKGLSEKDIEEVDARLEHWADLVEAQTGLSARSAAGAGAAGGAGFALFSLGASGRPGIDLVLDEIGFESALGQASLVVLGEGKLDSQTLRGKAPAGVATRARARGVPVIAVAGRIELSESELADFGVRNAYALCDLEPEPSKSMRNARALLTEVGARIAKECLS